MTSLLADIRFGTRTLARNPGFALVAVLTLALGIGANTTLFSFLYALLFRPLPVISQPENLVFLSRSHSYADFLYFRDNASSFSGVLAEGGKFDVQLDDAASSAPVRAELVSANYFSILGVPASIGRTLLPEEDLRPGANPVAVISHGLWQRRFGQDPAVLGSQIRINGFPFTIVGVTPAGFFGNEVGLPRELWIPLSMQPQVAPHSGESGPDNLTNPNLYWLNVVARLKPGASIPLAEAELNTLLNRPEFSEREDFLRRVSLFPVAGGLDPRERGEFLPVSAILMALVGMVLLIACANLANFLLARAFHRRREIGIRLALGSSRKRLITQLLAENLPLAILGGAGGLLLALWAKEVLASFEIPGAGTISMDLRLDAPVLLFTLAVSFLSVFLFGLLPAIQSARLDLLTALKDDGSARFRRSRLAGSLVISQVAFSLVLLVCAGLFLHSLFAARRMDIGFSADSTLAFPLRVLDSASSAENRYSLFQQLTDRSASFPGVTSVSLARTIPLGPSRSRASASPEPQSAGSDVAEFQVGFNVVAPRYFETIGLSILRGREFSSADSPGAPAAVIINQTLASRLWHGQDPIGRRLLFGGPQGRPLIVVGLARDAVYEQPGESPLSYIYLPLAQSSEQSMTLVVRTSENPRALLPALQKNLLASEPRLAILPGYSLRSQLDAALSPFRLTAKILSSLGFTALAMTTIGLFGVMTHVVSRRTREMGIRMALGASPRDVLRLILREGLRSVSIGIAIGLVGSLALAQLLSSFLIGIGPVDAVTFLLVSAVMVLVALLACWIPARRATRTDPLVALRYE